MGRLFPKAVLTAAVLHGALFFALSGQSRASSLALPPPDGEPLEVQIEVLTPVVVPDQGEPSGGQTADSTSPVAPSEGKQAASGRLIAPVLTAPEAATGAPALAASAVSPANSAPSPFGEPGGEGDGAARGRQAVAGLMRGGGWLLGPTAPAVEPFGAGPRRDDPDHGGKLLRETMGQADTARGLGFGGPVANAAHAASLSSGAPTQGAVTFEVVTDATGSIVSVTMRGGSGGDWSTVTAALRSQLAGRRLRVPDGARGVAVTVQVEARQQLPSGKAAGSGPVKMTGPVGGEFDLADLSGRVARVVSARIVNERRL